MGGIQQIPHVTKATGNTRLAVVSLVRWYQEDGRFALLTGRWVQVDAFTGR
jgi:hypothetical protein